MPWPPLGGHHDQAGIGAGHESGEARITGQPGDVVDDPGARGERCLGGQAATGVSGDRDVDRVGEQRDGRRETVGLL